MIKSCIIRPPSCSMNGIISHVHVLYYCGRKSSCAVVLISDEHSSSNLSDTKASQGSDDDEDEIVTEALQFNQLSLEEFCMILLSRVLPVFKGSLSINSAIIESSINLLYEVLNLMKNIFSADLWQCGSQLNSLMVRDHLWWLLITNKSFLYLCIDLFMRSVFYMAHHY